MPTAQSPRAALALARQIGFPVVVCGSFCMTPAIVCHDEVSFAHHARIRLRTSPIYEVSVTEYCPPPPVPLNQCVFVANEAEAITALVGSQLAEFGQSPLEFLLMRFSNLPDRSSPTVAKFISAGAQDRISTLAFVFQERNLCGYGHILIRPISAREAYGNKELEAVAEEMGFPVELRPWYTTGPSLPWRVTGTQGLARAFHRIRKKSAIGVHRVVKVGSA